MNTIESTCEQVKAESERLFRLGRPLDIADVRDMLTELANDEAGKRNHGASGLCCQLRLQERARAEAAEARVADLLKSLLAEYKAADEERLHETNEAHDEAEKWKAQNDMYGWNFHEGRSAGITWASIIFYRVRKLIEAL